MTNNSNNSRLEYLLNTEEQKNEIRIEFLASTQEQNNLIKYLSNREQQTTSTTFEFSISRTHTCTETEATFGSGISRVNKYCNNIRMEYISNTEMLQQNSNRI